MLRLMPYVHARWLGKNDAHGCFPRHAISPLPATKTPLPFSDTFGHYIGLYMGNGNENGNHYIIEAYSGII